MILLHIVDIGYLQHPITAALSVVMMIVSILLLRFHVSVMATSE